MQAGTPREFVANGQSVTFVPLGIRRKQNRKILVPSSGSHIPSQSPTLDVAMVKTLGRAFYWQKLLDDGEVSGVKELCTRMQLESGWVSEVLRLTLLAPSIVEAIFNGKQPRHINLHTIRGRMDTISTDWKVQREMLGLD